MLFKFFTKKKTLEESIAEKLKNNSKNTNKYTPIQLKICQDRLKEYPIDRSYFQSDNLDKSLREIFKCQDKTINHCSSKCINNKCADCYFAWFDPLDHMYGGTTWLCSFSSIIHNLERGEITYDQDKLNKQKFEIVQDYVQRVVSEENSLRLFKQILYEKYLRI